ncbi:MAG: hypothetical protein ACREOQ_17180 [Gemmatimonadales bacterium]
MAPARRSSLILGSLLALCLGCQDNTGPGLQRSTPGSAPEGPSTPPPPPNTPLPPPSTPPPSAPLPPPAAMNGFVWGQVLDSTGLCLPGGMVEIVDGPGVGRTSSQPAQCDAWDYVGFDIESLPMDGKVTLHASAPGYRPEDRRVVVPNGGWPVQFVLVPE